MPLPMPLPRLPVSPVGGNAIQPPINIPPGRPFQLPGGNNIVPFRPPAAPPITPGGLLPTAPRPALPQPMGLDPFGLDSPRPNPFYPLFGAPVFAPGEGLLNPKPEPVLSPPPVNMPVRPGSPGAFLLSNIQLFISSYIKFDTAFGDRPTGLNPPLDLPLIAKNTNPPEMTSRRTQNGPIGVGTFWDNRGTEYLDQYGNSTVSVIPYNSSGLTFQSRPRSSPAMNNSGTAAPTAPTAPPTPATPPPTPDAPPAPLPNPVPDGVPDIVPFRRRSVPPSTPPPKRPPITPDPPTTPAPPEPAQPKKDPPPESDPPAPTPPEQPSPAETPDRPSPSPSRPPSPSPSPSPPPQENPEPERPPLIPAPSPSPGTPPQPVNPIPINPVVVPPLAPSPIPAPGTDPTTAPTPATPTAPNPARPVTPVRPTAPSPITPPQPVNPIPINPVVVPPLAPIQPGTPTTPTVVPAQPTPPTTDPVPSTEPVSPTDPATPPNQAPNIPGTLPPTGTPGAPTQTPTQAPGKSPLPVAPGNPTVVENTIIPPIFAKPIPPPIDVPFKELPKGTQGTPVNIRPGGAIVPSAGPIVPSNPGPIDPCQPADPCISQIRDIVKSADTKSNATNAAAAAIVAALTPIPVQVKVFLTCSGDEARYGTETVLIPANSVLYVQKLFEKIANTQGEHCKECTAIATVPEWWQVRPEAQRKQGVLVFRELKPDGTLGSDYYAITIPHFNRSTAPTTAPLTQYQKGNFEGILTLKDNSKLIVNCRDAAECTRVIDILKPFIEPAQLEGASTKIGERRGLPFKQIEVKSFRLDYYPTGVKSLRPSYVKAYS